MPQPPAGTPGCTYSPGFDREVALHNLSGRQPLQGCTRCTGGNL